MRTNRTKKGFVLLIVVMLIALTGLILSFLTTASNTMLYQSNTAYLQACQRNLTASGLAWAKQNLQKDSSGTSGKLIELDVTEMNIHGSSLAVTLSRPAQAQPQVQIRTSCSRGRKTLTSDQLYSIRSW